MDQEQVTLTLPISGHALGTILFVLGVIALSVVVFFITHRGEEKNWLSSLQEKAGLSGLHPVLVIFVALTWSALFLTFLVGMFWVLYAIGVHIVAVDAEKALDLRWYLLTLTATTAALGAVVSFPFTLIRLQLNRRQTETAEQGHITDRINKAVAGLGAEKIVRQQRKDKKGNLTYGKKVDGKADYSQPVMMDLTQPNLEVRIGAIYALERIAQDSDRDHVQIMEILCAYIRENSISHQLTPREPTFERERPRVDIQATIDVIGRRSEMGVAKERSQKYRLDLRNTDLSFVSFSNGNFSAAILVKCRLEACFFHDADLSGVILNYSLLNFSDFRRADLTGARLDHAVINRPHPPAGLFAPSITTANLRGASFPAANLTALDYLGGISKMNQLMGSRDTLLSGNLRFQKPENRVMGINAIRQSGDLSEQNLEDIKIVDKAGFKHWFPFDSDDEALEPSRIDFLTEMNLNRWPYVG